MLHYYSVKGHIKMTRYCTINNNESTKIKIRIRVKHGHSHDLNYRSNKIDISSMVDKYFNNIYISLTTCKVKGCPSILL